MLIVNAELITLGAEARIISDAALLLDGERIAAIGGRAELEARQPEAAIVDARGQYVMPGGICAHTHFYGAYARGMAIPGAPPRDFPETLKRLWWPLDKALGP